MYMTFYKIVPRDTHAYVLCAVVQLVCVCMSVCLASLCVSLFYRCI